jgi:short-subunit dehydrogenase
MKKIAVITGASSGIGFQLATLLADGGFSVYDLSRSGSDREGITHIHTDLSDESSVKSAFTRIAAQTNRIDLLINNAGMGISGAVEHTRIEDAKNLFDVNFFGMVCAVQNAIPLLRAAKGRIVNVSSAAAALPVPFQAFYSASKAAVNSYSMALANELKRFGITVCAIMPGDVNTGFTAARNKNNEGADIYGGAIERSVSQMERDELNGMDSLYAARQIFRIACSRKAKLISTVGPKYWLFVILGKFLPAQIVNRIVGLIYAK